jgi:hypothetical protein
VLSRKKKRQAEDIARNNFETAGGYYAAGRDIQKRKDLAEKWTKEDIEALRDGFGQQYGSILTSILISLMLKIALKLIEKWVNKKIDELLGE